MANKILVISLGGSIIIPQADRIDVSFLKEFRRIILEFTKQGNKVIVITGGGKINKLYNEASQKVAEIKPVDLDWLGIAFTKVNAELVRSIFGSFAHKQVMADPTEKIKTSKKIIIGGGWKPGCSSDKDAVLAARNIGAKTIVNLTNIDYVYTADPRRDKTAKPIKQISWSKYRQIIGGKWVPRMNSPFDPIAAKLAQKLGLAVVILKGTDLANFKRYLAGKKFKGTVIKKAATP